MDDTPGDSTPCTLNIPGLKQPVFLTLHSGIDTGVSDAIRRNGIWESYETQLILNWLRPGDTFVDVGANLGYYSALAAQRVGGDGHVYAFEPDPGNYHLLRKNMQPFPVTATHLQQAALGDEDRWIWLYRNETNLGDHQIYDDGSGRSPIPVSQVRGDDALKSVCQAKLIKVDTQGAEWQVVRGVRQLIDRSSPNLAIVLEYWPRGLRRAGASSAQLCRLLQDHSLEPQIIDHAGHTLKATGFDRLREWGEWSEGSEGNEGFINLWLTALP